MCAFGSDFAANSFVLPSMLLMRFCTEEQLIIFIHNIMGSITGEILHIVTRCGGCCKRNRVAAGYCLGNTNHRAVFQTVQGNLVGITVNIIIRTVANNIAAVV